MFGFRVATIEFCDDELATNYDELATGTTKWYHFVSTERYNNMILR